MTALNGHSHAMITADIGQDFVQLALGVARHIPDCLHDYWGPMDWPESASADPPSLHTLRSQAVNFATAIQQSSLPKNRQQRLQFQTRALLWMIRAKLGEQIIFSEQVRLLLDVQPESVDISAFSQAQEGLAAILPEGDTLNQRWLDWQAAYTLPLKVVLPQLRQAFIYLSNFWHKAVEFELKLTAQGQNITYQPYTVFLPANMEIRVDRLVHLAAEWAAMCGMVTAAASRYEAGETESAVWLNYGPQQLLAQGLPPSFQLTTEPYDETIPSIMQALKLPAISARELQSIHIAEDTLRWVDANIALMLHAEGMRPRVLRRYLMGHKLVDQETAVNLLDRLSDPIQAAHVFAPLIGGPLVRAWLDKSQTTIDELLNDPPVPSTMLFEIRFGD